MAIWLTNRIFVVNVGFHRQILANLLSVVTNVSTFRHPLDFLSSEVGPDCQSFIRIGRRALGPLSQHQAASMLRRVRLSLAVLECEKHNREHERCQC